MPTVSRRNFLKMATNALFGLGGLLGLGGLVRFFSYQPDPKPPSEFDLGPASEYPPGAHTELPWIPAVLYNKHDQFVAYSLICSHLGCTVELDEEGNFVCPCHGSRYASDGRVLQGPAQKALRQLRVEVEEDGSLKLFTK